MDRRKAAVRNLITSQGEVGRTHWRIRDYLTEDKNQALKLGDRAALT